MKKLYSCLMAASLVLISSGCEVMTRSEMRDAEQKKNSQDQMVELQKSADQTQKLNEYEEELRQLNGKIESLENQISSSSADKDKQKQVESDRVAELERKLNLLQEELAKKSAQPAIKPAGPSSDASGAKASSDDYDKGEEAFKQKDWKNAILSFQKYREINPKSKKIPDSIYKIGVSFQELGLKDEAQTFYNEVIEKYPLSGEAKKSKTRLKSLK